MGGLPSQTAIKLESYYLNQYWFLVNWILRNKPEKYNLLAIFSRTHCVKNEEINKYVYMYLEA